MEKDMRTIVERAGGIFVGITRGCDREDVLHFKAAPDSDVLTLYVHAARSTDDVQLALKDFHEKQRAAMWEMSV